MDFYSVIKRNECNNMNESKNNYAEQKKPDTKSTYCMIPSI